jgi:hypothetical protein
MKTLPDRRTFLSELVASLNLAQAKCGIITRLLLSVDRGASVQDCKETIDIAIEAFENQTAGITCQPKPKPKPAPHYARPLIELCFTSNVRISPVDS